MNEAKLGNFPEVISTLPPTLHAVCRAGVDLVAVVIMRRAGWCFLRHCRGRALLVPGVVYARARHQALSPAIFFLFRVVWPDDAAALTSSSWP